MMKKTKCNVILTGCGWLGSQMVPTLLSHQHSVCATSRQAERINNLLAKGVLAAPFSLGETFPTSLISTTLPTTVILMLPPGRRSTNTDAWQASLMRLIDELLQHGVSHIIFVSSTSVYGDSSSEVIDESSPAAAETASAKAHVNIEGYLAENAADSFTVIRLAGLVGGKRHPANSLSGRNMTAPNKRVNLVHGQDAVNALIKLVELGPLKQNLHLCSLQHPQRKAYYDWCAVQLSIPAAQFEPNDNSLPSTGKIIDATKTWSRLGLEPVYPSPYDML